jgi:hypothetical protein
MMLPLLPPDIFQRAFTMTVPAASARELLRDIAWEVREDYLAKTAGTHTGAPCVLGLARAAS